MRTFVLPRDFLETSTSPPYQKTEGPVESREEFFSRTDLLLPLTLEISNTPFGVNPTAQTILDNWPHSETSTNSTNLNYNQNSVVVIVMIRGNSSQWCFFVSQKEFDENKEILTPPKNVAEDSEQYEDTRVHFFRCYFTKRPLALLEELKTSFLMRTFILPRYYLETSTGTPYQKTEGKVESREELFSRTDLLHPLKRRNSNTPFGPNPPAQTILDNWPHSGASTSSTSQDANQNFGPVVVIVLIRGDSAQWCFFDSQNVFEENKEILTPPKNIAEDSEQFDDARVHFFRCYFTNRPDDLLKELKTAKSPQKKMIDDGNNKNHFFFRPHLTSSRGRPASTPITIVHVEGLKQLDFKLHMSTAMSGGSEVQDQTKYGSCPGNIENVSISILSKNATTDLSRRSGQSPTQEITSSFELSTTSEPSTPGTTPVRRDSSENTVAPLPVPVSFNSDDDNNNNLPKKNPCLLL